MRRVVNAALSLLLAFVVAAAQTAGGEEVKRLANEGARAYKDGRFEEAQRLFERALELDPEAKLTPLSKNLTTFIARAAHRQYRPGVETPENRQRGEAAVEAYKRVIADARADAKHKEDAFAAVAYLYRQMGDEEREREWLLARAGDPSAPNEKRADAYVILASKRWQCSHDINERVDNKQAIEAGARGVSVRYRKPKSQADFDRSQTCVREGLDMVEQAIALSPNHASVWSYKTNLLRERAKLAQMEGNAAAQAEYGRLAEEAEATHKRLQGEQARRREGESKDGTRAGPAGPIGPPVTPDAAHDSRSLDVPSTTTQGGDGRGRRMMVSGGVINSKAVSKPEPVYPPEAREAGVSGTVTVQVTLDEEGAVAEAVAIGGHELLRAAAVEAVRRWRFSQTRLSGQPVRVTGIVIINFVLP